MSKKDKFFLKYFSNHNGIVIFKKKTKKMWVIQNIIQNYPKWITIIHFVLFCPFLDNSDFAKKITQKKVYSNKNF